MKRFSSWLYAIGLFFIFLTSAHAADECGVSDYTAVIGGSETYSNTESLDTESTDTYYLQFQQAGRIDITITPSNKARFTISDIQCPSDTGGSISRTIYTSEPADFNLRVNVSNNTDYTLTVDFTAGAVNNACADAVDFFTIDGTEENLTGSSTSGVNITDNYYRINAAALEGYDINGTLRVNAYSTNFNNIGTIEFLDEDCSVVPGYLFSDVNSISFARFLDSDGTWYVHIRDDNNDNPTVTTAVIWYPDVNGTSGGNGSNPVYLEPAIFKGVDIGQGSYGYLGTKIVNQEHNVKVDVLLSDGEEDTPDPIYTTFSGNFMFELVDATDWVANGGSTHCKQLPTLKYNGILGVTNADHGTMETGDNSTAHGPALSYDRAAKNVSYRMTYLVDPTNGGVIRYEDLVQANGCVGNTQSCMWGVLESLVSTNADPYLPDFSIRDYCGQFCQPGVGEGNNQVSPQCAQCVFGGFGFADCSDPFAIRPESFDSNLTALIAPIRAAEGTVIEFQALDGAGTPAPSLDYNETQNTSFAVDISISDPARNCQFPTMNLDPLVVYANGDVNGTYLFNHIGEFNLTVHEVNGSEFAVIDHGDTHIDDSVRLIAPYTKSITVIPDHFDFDFDYKDHNDANNFTYLSRDLNMSSELDLNITAKNAANATTPNYTADCYAHSIDLNLSHSTVPDPLTEIVVKETNSSTELNVTKTESIDFAALSNSVFATGDTNGTAQLEVLINFDRNQTRVVDPFPFTLTTVNVVDENGSQGNDTINQVAHMFYARSHAPRYRIAGNNEGNATNYYEVYSGTPTNATLIGLFTPYTPPRSVDSVRWYRNTHHTAADGNITYAGAPNGNTYQRGFAGTTGTAKVKENAAYATTSKTTIPYLYDGTKGYPYKATIIVNTNNWLIYDKYRPSVTTNDFEIEFYGLGSWAGTDESNISSGINAAGNTNRRIQW
jgi:hypothetical protein